jgi:signal transduction histidine kinase
VLQLSRLTVDLLVLARSDAGLPLEQRVEVDLSALATRVAERYGPLASQRGIRVQVVGSGGFVEGDQLLERMLANLIDNAVKYSPTASRAR